MTSLLSLPVVVAAATAAGGQPQGARPDAAVPVLRDHVTPREVVVRDLHELLDAPGTEARLVSYLEDASVGLAKRLARVGPSSKRAMTEHLTRLVAGNLEAKRGLGLSYDEARVRRQIIDYEAFKLATFVATGVFPKRYFGYLDGQGDTAAYEARLTVAVRQATAACNQWLEDQKSPLRVTEQEIIVTFLAEGGAILLREKQDSLESIHPVYGIGLDYIASGFDQLEPLVKKVDQAVGTRLASVVETRGGRKVLARSFRFEEAIAGTAVMWVWEKQITERKLRAKGRPSLATRPLDEQFVIASLVYNSGALFEEQTIARIRALDTGDYLYNSSERSRTRREPLPVLLPKDSLALLLAGSGYPEQPTSWSGAYHVLQRYGAYVALTRFTDAFDDHGMLRARR